MAFSYTKTGLAALHRRVGYPGFGMMHRQGLSCSLVQDSDCMPDVHLLDELHIQLGQAYAVCTQGSAVRLLVQWQSSVHIEAMILGHAAVCCPTVCVKTLRSMQDYTA